ncbi:MAG: AAA family ATPase [Candidatus Scalindua sp.]
MNQHTIELDSSNQPFYLDGELYKVREFKDILYNKDLGNPLGVSFLFHKAEFSTINKPQIISLFNVFDDYQCLVEIKYDYKNNKPFVREFCVKFIFPEGQVRKQYIKFVENSNGSYSIETNKDYFGEGLLFDKPMITHIRYSSIFPLFYEEKKKIEYEIDKNEGTTTEFEFIKKLIKIDDIKILIQTFFEKISYIGPLREQPKDEYSISSSHKSVGTKGEFVAQILENHSQDPIQFYKINFHEDGITYQQEEGLLLAGVKYWMCDVFGIAKDIYSERKEDSYKILLEGYSGLLTTIKHVGFGISQLLPIIVEGLRMPSNGTLILEQPEIHLHPKLQSLLFDFLYSLTLQRKTIIVETHSNHLITRMRRRVAENMSNTMDNNINLTFIESRKGKHLFRTLNLDDFGTLDYFPKDFIEQSSSELKAIVKAQMIKRKND